MALMYLSSLLLCWLQTVNSFPSERALVLRERAAGTYYVSAYFMAKVRMIDTDMHIYVGIMD